MPGVMFTEEAAARIVEAARIVLANRSILGGPPNAPGASPAEAFTARCTSATADGSGNYPAVITRYDAPTAAYVDYGACKLHMPNGEVAASGTNYPVTPAGTTSGGDALYLVGAVAGGGGGTGNVPPGAILFTSSISPPAGWLLCDGSTVSRTVYADLFAAVGIVWGAGDGSTTFRIPYSPGAGIPSGTGGTVDIYYHVKY